MKNNKRKQSCQYRFEVKHGTSGSYGNPFKTIEIEEITGKGCEENYIDQDGDYFCWF